MGWRIKRILRSRLPERFAGKLPPLLVELGIGSVLAALLVGVRIFFLPWMGDGAPFAQVFVGVVAAAMLGGWRSGLVAMILGQALSWYYIVTPGALFAAEGGTQIEGLVLATFSQLVALVIIALYQREVALAWSKRETQFDFLEKALKEIDHRTSNNYQTVLALVLTQAKGSHGEVRHALEQVAHRIRAVADAQRKLALSSVSLEEVRVAEHLEDLCGNIHRGLSRKGVDLECDYDEDIVLGADETVCLSILLNELVTNALKHAFPDGRGGTIRVSLTKQRGMVELTVEDDGVGMDGSGESRGSGLGGRLIHTFVRQLKAKHDVSSSANGTTHRIRIPA